MCRQQQRGVTPRLHIRGHPFPNKEGTQILNQVSDGFDAIAQILDVMSMSSAKLPLCLINKFYNFLTKALNANHHQLNNDGFSIDWPDHAADLQHRFRLKVSSDGTLINIRSTRPWAGDREHVSCPIFMGGRHSIVPRQIISAAVYYFFPFFPMFHCHNGDFRKSKTL